MSEKKPDNARSRDDTHLRKLVSETREWTQAEGIEELPLDWEASPAKSKPSGGASGCGRL